MMPFSQIYRVESISKRDIEFVMSEIIFYGNEYQGLGGIMFLISIQFIRKI